MSVQPTILIVEDEAKMRRLLELNLGEDGFTVLSAGDAETGLKMLAGNAVDLVVTDLKLGDSAGAVALWIGPGTEGYFTGLNIQPSTPR